MKTTETTLSHGTIPADYVPRVGDVFAVGEVALQVAHRSSEWVSVVIGGTVLRLDHCALEEWAFNNNATLTRAPE